MFFSKGLPFGQQKRPLTKQERVDQLSKKVCQLEIDLFSKYGNYRPPPSAKTDPITLALASIFTELKDIGIKTLPKCY